MLEKIVVLVLLAVVLGIKVCTFDPKIKLIEFLETAFLPREAGWNARTIMPTTISFVPKPSQKSTQRPFIISTGRHRRNFNQGEGNK